MSVTRDDPAVLAAAEALWRDADYDGDDTWANGDPMPEEHLYRAEVVVGAYREYVLSHRPDAERWRKLHDRIVLSQAMNEPSESLMATRSEAVDLLAALADATARAEATEAETARLGRDWGHRTEEIIAERDAAVADADAQRAAADEWQARYEELLAERGVER